MFSSASKLQRFLRLAFLANPFGRNLRDTDNLEPLPRKRAKQDFQQNVGQTDRSYTEKRAEEQYFHLTW